jgi:MarR family transcriptional regulator for hemolysin
VTHRADVGDVGADSERPAAARLDTVGDIFQRGGVAGGEDHGGPGGGERLGGGRADALARTGHERDPPAHRQLRTPVLITHDAPPYSLDIKAYGIKRLGSYRKCYPSLMSRPARQPLGLYLTRVSRTVSRAFDDALAEAGGSLPVWLVLISLKSGQLASQRELAEAVGIQGATLTHHLNTMESAGLVTRRRDPANRRLHLVELTPDGDTLFFRLRDAAMAFDQRLRAGLSDTEASQLEVLLNKLRDNVSAGR